MTSMCLGQLLNGCLDFSEELQKIALKLLTIIKDPQVPNRLQSALFAHLLRGHVGVRSCAIPVAGNRLRVQAHNHAKLLGDAFQDVPGHPQVIAHGHTHARAHLELPLGRHNLGICAANLHSGIETRLVVRLHDIAAENLVRSYAAVVRTLRSRIATLRPAQRLLVKVKQRVLLLNAEPRLLVGHLTGGFGARMSAVALARRLVELEGFAHDEDVVPALKGIAVDRHRMQVRVRVLANRLSRRAAVKVPDRQV